MTRTSLRLLAAGATSVVLAGTALALAAPANAADIGTLTIAPKVGTTSSTIAVTTSAGCPSGGTNIVGILRGQGFGTTGRQVIGNTDAGVSQSGPFTQAVGDTLAAIASQSPAVTLTTGRYEFVIRCQDAFGDTQYGDFVTSFWLTSTTQYQDVDPAGNQATTTAITAVSPTSPRQQGTPVTFEATVAPTGYPGTVQFFDGANALGSPVAVNTTTGKASLTTGALTVGSHSITARWTPAIQGLAPSTSAASTYVIEAAPAQATATTLAVSPASGTATQVDTVTLQATVDKPAAGSVVFRDGTEVLASVPVTVGASSATATYGQPFAAGTHDFSAEFVPADTGAYTGSTGTAPGYVVNAVEAATTSQTLQTTVAAGALTITVPTNPVVVLAEPVLNTAGSLFQSSGAINRVQVTDTRAGNPGWRATGIVTDFDGPGANEIHAANLGWTPALFSKSDAQTVTLGGAVAPADGVSASSSSTDGLASSRTLAQTAAGAGNGTALLDAALALNVPTSTLAGTYTATLTLTAV